MFLTLWDRLFGTFQAEPSRPIKAHDMGIDEVPNFPKSYLAQLVFPFAYRPGEGVQDPTGETKKQQRRGSLPPRRVAARPQALKPPKSKTGRLDDGPFRMLIHAGEGSIVRCSSTRRTRRWSWST